MTRAQFVAELVKEHLPHLHVPKGVKHMKATNQHDGQARNQVAKDVPMVGFYGCTNQIVRVSWVRKDRYHRAPQTHMVDPCPAWGNTHQVSNFMFRKAKSPDEFLLAEVGPIG